MDYIELNGASLACEKLGQGDPLIFVHGFLANGTGAYYADLKKRLATKYRVYSIDMRSHGGSAGVNDAVTLKQCARDVIALAEAVAPDGALLVGHSMGGYIGMSAAIAAPARFRALALMTPAASKGQPVPEAVIADFMATRADRDLMFDRFAGMFTSAPGENRLDILRDAALCLPEQVAEQWMRREWSDSDITDGLASIALPVLSMIGVRDVVVPPAVQYADALRMPHAKVISFTDQGHMLPVEAPELCLREVHRFFGDLD